MGWWGCGGLVVRESVEVRNDGEYGVGRLHRITFRWVV